MLFPGRDGMRLPLELRVDVAMKTLQFVGCSWSTRVACFFLSCADCASHTVPGRFDFFNFLILFFFFNYVNFVEFLSMFFLFFFSKM